MHLNESNFDLTLFDQVVNFSLYYIAGSYLLHSGAERRGASETLPEHGRGLKRGPALYPETHRESASHL